LVINNKRIAEEVGEIITGLFSQREPAILLLFRWITGFYRSTMPSLLMTKREKVFLIIN
jgi:hypothetical protein